MYFKDRNQAGELLAARILADEGGDFKKPLVIALPRGGVPVAFPIAKRLEAYLGVLLVRKLGVPQNPEYALGAVVEDGQVVLNAEAISLLGGENARLKKIIEETVASAVREMKRQQNLYRGERSPPKIKDRSVIVVDDGLATGSTMSAAVSSLKRRGASQISVAVPVASHETVESLKKDVDHFYVLHEPKALRSVGEWYEDFRQITDEEVVRLLQISPDDSGASTSRKEVQIKVDDIRLDGELSQPEKCRGWILFAHGSGSSRKSPRNLKVARALNEAGFGTLLFDLLAPNESNDWHNIFDIDLLAYRLSEVTKWLKSQSEWAGLPIGFFGASTGAAAALQACAENHPDIFAIVCRGGRPDLAWEHLLDVKSPVLLIVGGEDHEVIELNREAHARLPGSKIEIVTGAGHIFEEPGALEQVIKLARDWFTQALDEQKKDSKNVA